MNDDTTPYEDEAYERGRGDEYAAAAPLIRRAARLLADPDEFTPDAWSALLLDLKEYLQ